MPYRFVRVADRPSHIESDGPERILWIGALSFEERCVASFARLIEGGRTPATVLLFEYPTNVRPVAQDHERRRRNRVRLDALCGAFPNLKLEFVEIDPYSYRAAQRAVAESLGQLGATQVVLDVSCLTKIHAIALADPEIFATSVDWQLAYTSPETYGHLETSGGVGTGWRDVLVLPIGDSAELANETHARGVVLAGHEGDRLVIALTETEPAAGIIIMAAADRRPDLRRESERRNDKVTQLLIGRGDGRWRNEVISLRDPSALRRAIELEVTAATREDAPILLYPFGPKPFVTLAAMQMAAVPGLQAWFVYPIPISYDVDYSYGIGETLWYQPTLQANDGQQRLPIAQRRPG